MDSIAEICVADFDPFKKEGFMLKVFSMEAENKDLLIEGAKTFGIDLDDKAIEAFGLYLSELLKWNQKINLTAIRSEKGIVLKHYLDSLSVYPYLPEHSFILDIGSGAGFPGIPLKIIQPSFEVTLIDSVRKKVDFQRHIIRRLGLKGTEAIHGRVQDRGILRDLGGRFDIILSRAFSDLQTLLALSLPFLKQEGTVIAMKGEADDEEIRLLTGTEGIQYRLQKTIPLILPFSSFKRTILLFEKI
jgi:16S rRNA (guanine527-N7)-methyltransferase